VSANVRNVAILGFDGAEALDVIGPFDVFCKANELKNLRPAAYQPFILGIHKNWFVTESGLRIQAHVRDAKRAAFDTILVPGGSTLRDPKTCAPIAAWLKRNSEHARRVASVCTGFYALASTGLLEGRRATTHWRFAYDAALRWPAVKVEADLIYVKDGKYYTSAGITAGIDLALALVQEDLGKKAALAVARELVVYIKRSGGQLQYSEPLRYQDRDPQGLDDIIAWMRDHLGDDLSVESIAVQAHLSARHLTRKFKTAFGLPPADFVEELRLEEARWRLANGDGSIDRIAKSVGYKSDDSFRRAFRRQFGIPPTDYRSRFGT
jgi:transcriptional regulator GlxA family with amidase domain